METNNHSTKQKKKSSRTTLHKTKFVRVKKDQQLKDQYGAIFVSVYYALKSFSKNDYICNKISDICNTIRKKYGFSIDIQTVLW